MPNRIMDKLSRDVPSGDNILLTGLVKRQLENSADIVDQIFREAARHFPPVIEYLGYDICTPHETHQFILDSSIQKEYDIARNGLYLVNFKFLTTASGGPLTINKRILLPFTEHDGSVYLSGNRYYFKPVLTDRVISAKANGFFIRLMQDKFNCMEEGYNIIADGVYRMIFVLKTPVFNKVRMRQSRKNVPMQPAGAHYILIKYGLKETLKRYFDIPKYKAKLRRNVTDSDRKVYVVYESDNGKPDNIAIMIDRETIKKLKNKEGLEAFIAGTLYSIDIGHRIEEENNYYVTPATLNDPGAWRDSLTGILLEASKPNADNRTTTSLIREIMTHYDKLDTYLERQLQEYLIQGGSDIHSFYDLIAHIIKNSRQLRSENNIWMKYLDISYYIFYNFIETIFTIKNSIQNKLSMNARLTTKDVEKLFRRLSTRSFLNITKGGKRSIVLDLINYPGDNIYLGATQNITLQELGDGVNQSGRSNNKLLPGGLKKLHSYDIAIGSVLAIFKSRPTARVRLNLFVDYDHKRGMVNCKGRYKRKMDLLQRCLEGNEVFKKRV